MQTRLIMATADLERMCQRNQVNALEIYFKNPEFIALKNEVAASLKAAVPPAKKKADPYLLIHFAMASLADVIARFQAACIRAHDYLVLHHKAVLARQVIKKERAALLSVIKRYSPVYSQAIEAAAYPGALSDAALPNAGSFDPDDGRALQVDGTRVTLKLLKLSKSNEKRAIADAKSAAAKHGATSPRQFVARLSYCQSKTNTGGAVGNLGNSAEPVARAKLK